MFSGIRRFSMAAMVALVSFVASAPAAQLQAQRTQQSGGQAEERRSTPQDASKLPRLKRVGAATQPTVRAATPPRPQAPTQPEPEPQP